MTSPPSAVEGSVLTGDLAEKLREAARDADLLIVGSRAYGPLRAVLLGSVSAQLVRFAPCTVMVYPRGVETAEPTAGSLRKSLSHPGDNVRTL